MTFLLSLLAVATYAGVIEDGVGDIGRLELDYQAGFWLMVVCVILHFLCAVGIPFVKLPRDNANDGDQQGSLGSGTRSSDLRRGVASAPGSDRANRDDDAREKAKRAAVQDQPAGGDAFATGNPAFAATAPRRPVPPEGSAQMQL